MEGFRVFMDINKAKKSIICLSYFMRFYALNLLRNVRWRHEG